jgi:hypothetical protein
VSVSRVITFNPSETACLPTYLAAHLRCGHRLDVRQVHQKACKC